MNELTALSPAELDMVSGGAGAAAAAGPLVAGAGAADFLDFYGVIITPAAVAYGPADDVAVASAL